MKYYYGSVWPKGEDQDIEFLKSTSLAVLLDAISFLYPEHQFEVSNVAFEEVPLDEYRELAVKFVQGRDGNVIV